MCRCSCDHQGAVATPPEPPFTAEQVEDALAEGKSTHRNFYDSGTRTQTYHDGQGQTNWSEIFYASQSTDIQTPIGSIRLVESVGGEGEGDHAHLVVKVENGGQFFRKDGWYQSYDGLYLDGEFREVQEITKSVKVYE